MSKQRTLLAACLLIGSTAWGAASARDFQAGVAAAERGDFPSALAVWRPLAEAGDAASQFNLGMLYGRGDGVPQDYEEALRWLRMAAEQGRVEAQARVGGMYARGLGVAQDSRAAAGWLFQAAEQHHAVSQYELGVLYANGDGVERDTSMAYFWFTLAGLQHFQPAMDAQIRMRETMPPVEVGVVETQVQTWLQERVGDRAPAATDGSGG